MVFLLGKCSVLKKKNLHTLKKEALLEYLQALQSTELRIIHHMLLCWCSAQQ